MSGNSITYTREDLYEMVWAEPITAIAKKHNISDVGLRKICVRMGIPLPGNGYWSKQKWGKQGPKTALPSNFSGQKETKLEFRLDNEVVKVLSPVKMLQKEIENNKVLPIVVSDKLINPDLLVLKARESLTAKDRYRDHGLVSCRSDELSIKVSQENIKRALLFMDTFIKLIKARGHDICVKYGDTRVVIKTIEIKVKFREKLRREMVQQVPYSWSNAKYYPTGVLSFKIDRYDGKEWKDGQTRIEDRFPEILASLELRAEEELEWHLANEKARKVREERERQRKELIEQQDTELGNFQALLGMTNRYNQACLIRNYIAMFEKRGVGSGLIENDQLSAWLDWARKKADWYDPFVNGDDALLQELDKDTLVFKDREQKYRS